MNTVTLALPLVLIGAIGLQTPTTQTTLNQAPTQTATQTGTAQTPKLVTFNDQRLGLLFDHPATWIVQKHRKGHATSKSEQGVTVMSLPTATSPTGATLEIFHARFASTPEIWQTVQDRSNEQLNRTVDRQWQQDILGVPLLLTRISYTEKGVATTTLTGLLYTRTHEKMLFRLTGPTAEFDDVQYAFTTAMQTLRTVDGVMPVEEDPDHPLPPAKKGDPLPAPRIPIMQDVKPPKPYIAPNVLKLVISTRPVVFRYPNDWEVQKVAGNVVTFKGDDLSEPVTLTFQSTLDSDTPANTLMTLTSDDLGKFNSVSLRLDSPTLPNRAGCSISTVWRNGKDAKGALYTLQATGQQGDFYFVADYHGTDEGSAKDDKKALEKFLSMVSLQAQP